MRILGLDEAGRGSVVGPMSIGAFCCEAERSDALFDVGARDSKALSAKKRVLVRARLLPLGAHTVSLVSAAEIDAENINTLEERIFAALIIEHTPDRVFIDAPCHPRAIPNFTARLIATIQKGWPAGRPLPSFVIEPKADVTYPVVSAASIFAKIARDQSIVALSAQHAEGLGAVGSGYPSDPKTRAFIERCLRAGPLPACVRSRWGTIDKIRQKIQDT